jgi:hypothetical protein
MEFGQRLSVWILAALRLELELTTTLNDEQDCFP